MGRGSIVANADGAQGTGGGAADAVEETGFVGDRVFGASRGWGGDDLGGFRVVFRRQIMGGDGGGADGGGVEGHPSAADGVVAHRGLRGGLAFGLHETAGREESDGEKGGGELELHFRQVTVGS